MSSMPMPSCVSNTVIWRRGHTDSQCFRFPAVLNSKACSTSKGSAKSYLHPYHTTSLADYLSLQTSGRWHNSYNAVLILS